MNEENKALVRLPFVRFAPFLAVGMLVAYYGDSLASTIVICCSVVAFLFLVMKRNPVAISVAGLLLGCLVMLGFVKLRTEPVLSYAGKSVQAEIEVYEIIASSDEQQTITARIELSGVPTKVRLFTTEHLEEGQHALVQITFSERDPEWETYNIAKGTPLTGNAEIITAGEITAISGIVRAIRGIRGLFATRVREFLSGDVGLLAISMLFGMDESLPAVLSDKMGICGASHFTAVSGTHFSIISALMLGLIPVSRWRERAVVSLLFTPIAVVFFGATPSVIRASAMFFIYSLNSFFFRRSDTLNTLCVAVTAICLVSPASAIDIGFQMSVMGVLGAGVIGVKATDRLCEYLTENQKRFSPIIRILFVSSDAVICTAPLSAMFFKGISAAGVVTSIVMMPLISIAFIFAIMLGITGLGIFSVPLNLVMKIILLLVNSVGNLRTLWISIDFVGAWIIVALLAIVAIVWTMGDMKWNAVSKNCFALLTLFLLVGTFISNHIRLKTVALKDTNGSAEIAISGSSAKITITEINGDITQSLLQSLRENGVVSLSEINVNSEKYTGEIATTELMSVFAAA